MPPSTLAALREAKSRGCRLFIATGRPYQWIHTPVLEPLLPLMDGIINLNGAMASVGGEVCFTKPIEPAEVRALLADARRQDYSCVVVGQLRLTLFNAKSSAQYIFEQILQIGVSDMPVTCDATDYDEPVLQLSPFFNQEQERVVMPSLPDSLCARWHPDFADVTAREATKGRALRAIVGQMGLDPSLTIAFGDGGNDISMFREAAVGVAMGGADEAVKAEADVVAPDVDDDGIARALESITQPHPKPLSGEKSLLARRFSASPRRGGWGMMLLIFLFLLCPLISLAQERPKVAVVLSGGGAKGTAHIGALRVIERAGIPVDIICGTSMGALVGGLYAIGYDAQALDSIVSNLDWSYVISDKENLEAQSLADRERRYTYAFSRSWGGKGDPTAGGLVAGKNLDVLFQRLCIDYLDSISFDSLPIPFSCVATNIIDNTEVDFHSGRLPEALRASMAIPAFFTPVRMGDMVLVDGGLRNNYPVDVARQMGADIVIGVTVQGEPKTADRLNNTMDILNQIVDVNCKNKYDDNLRQTNVAIRVDPSGYSTASFTSAAVDTLIRRGEAEAMRHWDELMEVKRKLPTPLPSSPEGEGLRVGAFSSPRGGWEGVWEGALRGIFDFENLTHADERFLRAKFHLHDGDSITLERAEQVVTSMRVDLFCQQARYRLRQQPDGLHIAFIAGSRKKFQAALGVRFDTEEKVALQLNAAVPLRARVPMDADLTLRLGKRLRATALLTLHPRAFTRPMLSYTISRNDLDAYALGHRDFTFVYNHHQADLVPLHFEARNFSWRALVRWDHYDFRDRLASSTASDLSLSDDHHFSYRARMDYASEDDWLFPTRGSRFRAEYAYVTDNFARLDGRAGANDVSAHWRTTLSLSPRFALQPMVYGRLLFAKTTLPPVLSNAIGGPWFAHYLPQQMPFAGLGHMEFVEPHLVAAQLQGQYRVGRNHFILLRAAAAEHASSLGRLFRRSPIVGVQGAYAFRTPFGPLGAQLGWNSRSHKAHALIDLGYEF